jgi:hypothetical protein
MPEMPDTFDIGQRVEVVQQIPHRDRVWATHVTGRVVCFEQRKTGSWFAHGKDDKLWLDRLTLRKDDGEIVVCILDRYTHVKVLAEASKTSESPDLHAPQTDTREPSQVVEASEREEQADAA